MKRDEAIQLIDETFTEPFDRDRFRSFVVNLLNDLNASKQASYSGNLIPDKFKEYVTSYERIGQYEDPQGYFLDILTIQLERETSLDRARTTQRNFAADYLERRDKPGKDSVLAVYYHENLDDYRLSYVKRE